MRRLPVAEKPRATYRPRVSSTVAGPRPPRAASTADCGVETPWVHRLLYADTDLSALFRQILTTVRIPLSIGLNQINGPMGKHDLYPFRHPGDRHGQARLSSSPWPNRPNRPDRRPTTTDASAAAQADPRD